MENERDRQLREEAEQKGNALYQYRLTPNGIADELINFAKSEAAKQYYQEQFKPSNDAIEFAEWIAKHEISAYQNGKVWSKLTVEYTTSQLYELFKTNKTRTK